MNFKNVLILFVIVFISACTSSNTKSDETTSSKPDSALVIKEDIVFEQEVMNLDKSKVVYLFNLDDSANISFINDKRVPNPFLRKRYNKFVILPGTVSFSIKLSLGARKTPFSTYKAKLEAGKRYAFATKKERHTDTVYFGLFDIDTDEQIEIFE